MRLVWTVSLGIVGMLVLLVSATSCNSEVPPSPQPLLTYTPPATPYPTPVLDLQATIEAILQQRLGEIQATAPRPTPIPAPTPTLPCLTYILEAL